MIHLNKNPGSNRNNMKQTDNMKMLMFYVTFKT